MSFERITSQFSHLPLLDTPYQMTREANVWLNGSEVNTQQMGGFFPFFFFPLPGDLVCSPSWIYEVGGTQGHSSHCTLGGSPFPLSATGPQATSGCVHASTRSHRGAGPARAGCTQGGRTVYPARHHSGQRAGNNSVSLPSWECCSPG